jgi:sulfite oxidase
MSRKADAERLAGTAARTSDAVERAWAAQQRAREAEVRRSARASGLQDPDERERLADLRERNADERDRLAGLREAAANERDRLADQRQHAAERRDHDADRRDFLADRRDVAADERDRIALRNYLRKTAEDKQPPSPEAVAEDVEPEDQPERATLEPAAVGNEAEAPSLRS